MSNIKIRTVQPDDLDHIAEIEAICFPPAEAASRQSFQARIAAFPESFLVAESAGSMIGFINGCATNSPVIYDAMFHHTQHHIPTGKHLAVFGLDVLPEYRQQGIAAQLMNAFIDLAKTTGRSQVILTCKAGLLDYYQTFGFTSSGVSGSTHGGSQWFDMTLVL